MTQPANVLRSDRLIEAANFDPAAGNILLVHVADAAAYSAAHIPGAVLVEPASLVSGVPPATGRLPATTALSALFSALGYDPAQTIIAYDDEGGGWAGRFLWTLDVIGHQSWGYLNGGIHAWAAAGKSIATGPAERWEPTREPVRVQVHSQPIAEIDDVLAAIEDDASVIWDVRSAEEYTGQRQAAARVGHIPGAVNLDWLHLQDSQRKLRADAPELLAGLGITADKKVITHCQTHHRSGLSYLVGRLLGLNISAYHGSWSEWGNRDDTPVVTGPDPVPRPA